MALKGCRTDLEPFNTQFRGLHESTFELYFKEYKFRLNYRYQNCSSSNINNRKKYTRLSYCAPYKIEPLALFGGKMIKILLKAFFTLLATIGPIENEAFSLDSLKATALRQVGILPYKPR